MARLKRVTNKIFGSTASTVGSPETGAEIGQFGSAKIGTYNATSNVEVIQSLPAYEQGWIGAVIPNQQYPTLPEMTGVNKVLSYQTGYLMQEGIAEWDENTTYYKNSIVKHALYTTTRTATADIGTSVGITSASVDKDTFLTQITIDDTYTFIYNGESWLFNDIETDLSIYGITYNGEPAIDDEIIITLSTDYTYQDAHCFISLKDNNTTTPVNDNVNWKLWGEPDTSNFANKDLSNLSTTGKSYASGLGMPSERYTLLTLGASGTQYTAPANGWFSISKQAGSTSGVRMAINTRPNSSTTTYRVNTHWITATSGSSLHLMHPVRKNDVVDVTYTASGTTNYFVFIYAEGNN